MFLKKKKTFRDILSNKKSTKNLYTSLKCVKIFFFLRCHFSILGCTNAVCSIFIAKSVFNFRFRATRRQRARSYTVGAVLFFISFFDVKTANLLER